MQNITKEQLYQERITRMNNAIELKENDRVPQFSLADNWALFYSGTSLKQAYNDSEIEFRAYAKAHTDFKFDAAAFPGITIPLQFFTSLGGGIYKGDMDTIQIQTSQSEIMPVEDYDLLIKDPKNYFVNTLLPKKLGIFQHGTINEKFNNYAGSLGHLLQWFQERGNFAERYKTEYGLPVPNAVPPYVPADLILDSLRDFKGTISDVKRCPDKLAEACMSILLNYTIPTTYATMPKPLPDKYLNLFLHLPQFLKPKDFEKVYWPTFKLYIDTFAKQGYKFMILFEKNYEHLYDYLQDLPKGAVLGMFEEDDLRKTKKALGKNMCIGGGISTNDLAYKTPQECVDIAKELIDDLAPGGGYVFSVDRVLNSYNDAKPECLKAVTDFVHDYAKY